MYLAYTRQTFITAKLLAENLNLRKNKNILDYPPIIRWGNSFNYFGENDTKFNDPRLIYISSSKILTYKMLSSNNINCTEYKRGIPDNFPVLIRKLLNSSKGRGIVVVNNEDEYLDEYQNFYYSPFINFDREFRIHILGGNIVKVMEKVPLEENIIIKNSETCTFKRRDIERLSCGKNISEIVDKLFSVFPMQMMGVDIGVVKDMPYIIEINSAPSLNSLTLQLYVEFLGEKCLLQNQR